MQEENYQVVSLLLLIKTSAINIDYHDELMSHRKLSKKIYHRKFHYQ